MKGDVKSARVAPSGDPRQSRRVLYNFDGFGCMYTKAGGKPLSPDNYRASAGKLVESGADGVYIFNFFTTREHDENSTEPPFEVRKEIGR